MLSFFTLSAFLFLPVLFSSLLLLSVPLSFTLFFSLLFVSSFLLPPSFYLAIRTMHRLNVTDGVKVIQNLKLYYSIEHLYRPVCPYFFSTRRSFPAKHGSLTFFSQCLPFSLPQHSEKGAAQIFMHIVEY